VKAAAPGLGGRQTLRFVARRAFPAVLCSAEDLAGAPLRTVPAVLVLTGPPLAGATAWEKLSPSPHREADHMDVADSADRATGAERSRTRRNREIENTPGRSSRCTATWKCLQRESGLRSWTSSGGENARTDHDHGVTLLWASKNRAPRTTLHECAKSWLDQLVKCPQIRRRGDIRDLAIKARVG